jgi:hypothetical protein
VHYNAVPMPAINTTASNQTVINNDSTINNGNVNVNAGIANVNIGIRINESRKLQLLLTRLLQVFQRRLLLKLIVI